MATIFLDSVFMRDIIFNNSNGFMFKKDNKLESSDSILTEGILKVITKEKTIRKIDSPIIIHSDT